jgi:pyruvate carboxylase subunit B
LIEPEMEKVKKETEGLAKNVCDTLVCALFPQTGTQFLKWKYGLEPVPDKVKPKTLEDVKKEDEAIAKAKAESQRKTV